MAPVVTDPGRYQVTIGDPPDGLFVSGIVPVFSSANVPDFGSYELQYGVSHNPGAFSTPIFGPVGTPVSNSQLGIWDTTGLENGPHTLRLLVRDQKGAQYEARVRGLWRIGHRKKRRPLDTQPPPPTLTPALSANGNADAGAAAAHARTTDTGTTNPRTTDAHTGAHRTADRGTGTFANRNSNGDADGRGYADVDT